MIAPRPSMNRGQRCCFSLTRWLGGFEAATIVGMTFTAFATQHEALPTTQTNSSPALPLTTPRPLLRDFPESAIPEPATTNCPATNVSLKVPVATEPTVTVAAFTHVRPVAVTNIVQTNLPAPVTLEKLQETLETARNFRRQRLPKEATPLLVALLDDASPESVKQSALLELAMVAQDENDLPRAQQIYAQFLNRWTDDSRVPEILLRQGQLFRQIGVNNLALAKFYSVMTAALALKNDQLEYYQKLVLQAQSEIAETHYLAGKFAEAADYYSRLLKQDNPALNRPLTQFRLVRSLYGVNRYDQTAAQGQDFLSRYPEAPEQPEVRFYLALAWKQLGRNSESLQQVLTLLQEQKVRSREHPEVWTYWQQRTGNEIANQLYREGDYPRALEIYLNLAALDSSPAWQVPVSYQIGMTYERLLQPESAVKTYSQIICREAQVGTNVTPGLKAVFDMARWRTNFIQWQERADSINHQLSRPPAAAGPSAPSTVAARSPGLAAQ